VDSIIPSTRSNTQQLTIWEADRHIRLLASNHVVCRPGIWLCKSTRCVVKSRMRARAKGTRQ